MILQVLPADSPTKTQIEISPDPRLRHKRPILRIVGPPLNGSGCGKSYTGELLDHVCGTTLGMTLVPVEIQRGTASSYPVGALADELVTPTTTPVSSRPPRTTSSYATALCNWILNAACNTAGTWIYLLDGFSDQDLPKETRDLVEALAVRIASNAYRRRFRLVLVDYPAPLPSLPSPRILKEDVLAASAVTAQDLVDCLNSHYQDLAARGSTRQPRALSELHTVAQTLVAAAPSNLAARLASFNSILTQLRLDDLSQVP